MCEQECLHSKRKVLSPDVKENGDAESFEGNCRCVYGPSHGNEQSFSFTDTWAEENKTENRLQKVTL